MNARVTLLDDGRDVRVDEDLQFTDAAGLQWTAPAGSIVNGASVPRFFWRLFPPLTGRYREASILHDVYCVNKSRPSPLVHAMFYEKMRHDGVACWKACCMWAAVRCFGPRFPGTSDC